MGDICYYSNRGAEGIKCNTFVEDEIKPALVAMHLSKVLSPDGYHAGFSQRFQHIICKDVISLALKFLNCGGLLANINQTFIVPISKIKNIVRMPDFRPISLCNVIYKFIAKTLANHLKEVLGCIIDESQSGFVPGRLITDNVIIAFEAFH